MGRKPLGMKPAELTTLRVQGELLDCIDAYARYRGIRRPQAIRELLKHSLRLFDRAQGRKKALRKGKR